MFLLFNVVRVKPASLGFSDAGRNLVMASVRSLIVEVDGRGMASVGGNDRPGNDERRTLMV